MGVGGWSTKLNLTLLRIQGLFFPNFLKIIQIFLHLVWGSIICVISVNDIKYNSMATLIYW